MRIPWHWEDMCGPQGLQPWNNVSKDVGQCFQELFLQIPVYFVIAIVSGYYVGYRRDWVIRERTQERALTVRSFVVLALAFIPIIELYVFVTDAAFVLYPVTYFVAGASCLAWLVHFGYVLALKHRLGQSSRGPSLQLLLWSVSVLLNLVALRTHVMAGDVLGFDIANLCCHILYFVSLIPSSDSRPTFYSPCLVGSQHSHSEYTPLLPHTDDGVLGTAMQGAGILSRLTFTWVNPLIQKGLENKLKDAEELFDVPTEYCCSCVGARMERALIGNVDNYQQYEEVPHEPFIGSSTGAADEPGPARARRVRVRRPRRHKASLLRALHSCFALQFYSIGLLKLAADMAGFAGPILLNYLIKFIQDESIDQRLGYLYAAGLLAAALAAALCTAHFNWRMALVALQLRGALVCAVLRKTLATTSAQLEQRFTVGEVTNFMSTDTDRIVNSCPSFHALWSIPLQLAITLLLLYQQVGVSFLAGVAFSVLLIPLNKVIADKIGRLSADMMRHKDERVSILSDVLKGIRTIKVHVWEDYFINRVTETREKELRYLRGRKYLDAVCVVLWATTPVLVAALTLGVHALRGRALDAPTAFTTVALINMLIAPLNAFPWVLNGLTEAWVSVKRIQRLLDLPDMDPESYYDRVNKNHDEDKMIIFKNATFSWARAAERRATPNSAKNKGTSKKNLSRGSIQRRDSASSSEGPDEPFALRDVSVAIGRGELVGVTGAVGSGKSSLLRAILGDMIKRGGVLQIPEDLDGFGYVSQRPWLVRGTVRDNILFGKPYDEARFRSVVDACALTEDLEALGWGAHAGEAGRALSGGQRARVALARALYRDCQVYLLDDVLAGVDSAVAQHIMSRAVLGLLRQRTRVLVAHAPRHLARASRVLALADGRVVRTGPPEAVLHDMEEFEASDGESPADASADSDLRAEPGPRDDGDNVSRNSLDDEEESSDGTVAWWVLGLYLRSVGAPLAASIVLSLVLMQLSQNFTFLWLAYWVRARAGNATAPAAAERTAGRRADAFYLEVYFGLAALTVLATVLRAFLFAYGGVRAAERVHRALLRVVLKAKVKFFDATPAGRILNRFSSDTYTVDDSLPFILNILLAQLCALIGALGVAVYALPWLAAALLPLALLYHRLQRAYRAASRQLRRAQSVALSPLYSHFGDTLEGLDTVRALGASGAWGARGVERAEAWQRAALGAAAAAQWLALRLQAAAAAVLGVAALLAVLQRSLRAADPALVGLAISYALSVASALANALSAFAETEREMIAVERVGDYIKNVECEDAAGEAPPYGWPSQGVIEFDDVYLKYSEREGAPAALRGVTFATRPGERLGVVGRTGAGKSSLLAALLRLAPVGGGAVRLDGVDVAALQLRALRSRIGVIPQEPFIFEGSVRDNVDPLRQHDDAELWRALGACGVRDALEARGGLDAPARGLARGHAQLLCAARALLRRPRVLLLDEATAHLDARAERRLLDALRGAGARCTTLHVAHRLRGVLECARVLVLGGGAVLELRAPDDALADPASHLYALVHGAGAH